MRAYWNHGTLHTRPACQQTAQKRLRQSSLWRGPSPLAGPSPLREGKQAELPPSAQLARRSSTRLRTNCSGSTAPSSKRRCRTRSPAPWLAAAPGGRPSGPLTRAAPTRWAREPPDLTRPPPFPGTRPPRGKPSAGGVAGGRPSARSLGSGRSAVGRDAVAKAAGGESWGLHRHKGEGKAQKVQIQRRRQVDHRPVFAAVVE